MIFVYYIVLRTRLCAPNAQATARDEAGTHLQIVVGIVGFGCEAEARADRLVHIHDVRNVMPAVCTGRHGGRDGRAEEKTLTIGRRVDNRVQKMRDAFRKRSTADSPASPAKQKNSSGQA